MARSSGTRQRSQPSKSPSDGSGSKARRATSAAKLRGARIADWMQERLPGPVGRIVETARSDDILLFAAGLAFYALVSVVPLAVLMAWVASLALGDDRVQQAAQQLQSVAPKNLQAGQFLERVARLGTSVGVAARVAALWPATSYGAGLRRALHRLSTPAKPEMQGIRGRGLALVVLLPLFVVGSLIGSYAGSTLVGEGVAWGFLGAVLALLMGFVGTAVASGLIFWIFPPERMPAREIGVAVLWTATSVSILSLGFTLFISFGANFQEHYASSGMATLVLLALWLFLANALLLVGYRMAHEG
jgi:YihY family inner membrane protein